MKRGGKEYAQEHFLDTDEENVATLVAKFQKDESHDDSAHSVAFLAAKQ